MKEKTKQRIKIEKAYEDYIKKMEYEIREKERKLQNVIEELTRKSNLNEE